MKAVIDLVQWHHSCVVCADPLTKAVKQTDKLVTGPVPHTFNPRTTKDEAGRSL